MSNATNICLTMIVKDEQNIIIRCLESCLPIIDYVFITDTGSTDNTIETITAWIAKQKQDKKLKDGSVIPGNIFKNFGASRTESFVNAKKELLKRNVSYCYMLLMDADMELMIDAFDRLSLRKEAYEILQYEDINIYPNIRLIDMNYNWEAKGVTHEFWRQHSLLPLSKDYELYTKIYILDHSDGNNKTQKYTRDIELLTEALKTEKEAGIIARYTFYIARSYFALRQYDTAIEWYKKRIELDDWIEEVYQSKFSLGTISSVQYYISKDIKHLHEARNYFLDAWLYRSTRAEPLYWLCVTELDYNLFDDRHFNTQKMKLVFMYCNSICKLPVSKDKMFVELDVYKWKVKYLLYISSFYAQEHEIGAKTYNELLKLNINHNYLTSIKNFRKKYKW